MPKTNLPELLADLADEGADLDACVADLPDRDWQRATPAPGWTIAHQISHLAWTDGAALTAATDADAFAALLADPGLLDAVENGAAKGAAEPPLRLLERWRAGRRALAGALAAVPAGTKIPWFGPPMGAASMATARIMETWAHGQDVTDSLAARRTPTKRLRHVAHIGVRARNFAYSVHGMTPPAGEFRVELTGPAGETWSWGPVDAEQRVTGPALDFCLLATRRRHRLDLGVKAHGAEADRWLDIVQAFAGPPGEGRKPGEPGTPP